MPKPRKTLISLKLHLTITASHDALGVPFYVVKINLPVKALNIDVNGFKRD
jgi:hypothetical protein